MNKRLRELRKFLKLSGEKFGERLGVKKNTISQLETGTNGISEQMIVSICREYNVNRDWLVEGKGEMFVSQDGVPLEEYIASLDLSEVDAQVIRAYFSLDKETRKNTLRKYRDFLNGLDL